MRSEMVRGLVRPAVRSVMRVPYPSGVSYSHGSVTFNGTNTYLNRGANLTGIADASVVLFYAKFNLTSLAAARTLLLGTALGATRLLVSVSAAGALAFTALDEAGDGNAGLIAGNGTISAGVTYQLQIYFDPTVGTGEYKLFPTGGPLASASITATGNVGALGWVTDSLPPDEWVIGSNATGTAYLYGSVSALWFGIDATGFGVNSFFNESTGADVDLGTDGTLSGLAAPLIFYGGRQTAANWNAGTNQGTGGDFTKNGDDLT